MQESDLTVNVQRERERLQCFTQPASLTTYRRRQRSDVEDIKTIQNELENLHMISLCQNDLMVFVRNLLAEELQGQWHDQLNRHLADIVIKP